MRPFKMFFGIAIAAILFLFVARIVFFAFIIASVMSVIYAIYRRAKDFITYDRFGDYYIPAYSTSSFKSYPNEDIEPLFHKPFQRRQEPVRKIHFIDAL